MMTIDEEAAAAAALMRSTLGFWNSTRNCQLTRDTKDINLIMPLI
jgi:hypothetical protein